MVEPIAVRKNPSLCQQADDLVQVVHEVTKPELSDFPRACGLPIASSTELQRFEGSTRFPKRCETGHGDDFNMECLWCGAPLGGVCQDRQRKDPE